MRRIRLLIVLLSLSVMATAQHWVGFFAEAGPSWTLDTLAVSSLKTGVSGGLGFTYQFQYSHFLLETGAGVGLSSWSVGVQDSVWHYDMVDTRGQAFVYTLSSEQRTDVSRSVALTVPLLAGVEYSYFYALAGVKLHLHLLGQTQQRALIRTSGEYDIYYDPLEDVPTHGFLDSDVHTVRGRMQYRTDLRGVLEVGAAFRASAGSPKYRIGAFVEYGFLNIRPASSALPLVEPDPAAMSVQMNHLYASDLSAVAPVHPLTCGIRFTVLFSVGDVPIRYVSPYRRSRYPCLCLGQW